MNIRNSISDPELYQRRSDNCFNLACILILTPILCHIIEESLLGLEDDRFKTMTLVSVFLTALVAITYTTIRDNYDFGIAIQEKNQVTSRKNLIDKNEETFHKRLEKAGFSNEEIKNHRKLGLFYDPVSFTLVNNPVITNTNDIVDEETAEKLIRNRLRLFSKERIVNFREVPVLKKLLNELVTEAIDEKKHKINYKN
ncbi:MAG: hypothetical protein KIT56_00685 [Gammaproteobacteria bacterium]|nr:hypothetical protein [Gammaproteobacteria bacterium]MCW5582402.1 hypothetical protein [Gammaproteobacteria bacterium]